MTTPPQGKTGPIAEIKGWVEGWWGLRYGNAWFYLLPLFAVICAWWLIQGLISLAA